MDARYAKLRYLVRGVLRLFFQKIEVDGLEYVPRDRGGLLIAWHPNGLIDPALMVGALPRQVAFGARHGLLKWPILGPLMRALGVVPIYRASDLRNQDEGTRRAANNKSLDALAQQIAGDRFAALFPEGVSHDAPHLMKMKRGAARLYYRARDHARWTAPAR